MADGAQVVTSLEDAPLDDAWVIGGSQVYGLALPLATRCEVTEIDLDLHRQDEDALAPLLDEAWVALGNPVWREKLRAWLKLLRSRNCAVVMATQSLSDASRSGLLDVLVESCPTKIYLPNDEALKRGTPETPGPNDLYRAMGLNDNQIEIIRTATPKREYYVVTPEGCRLVDLALGPLALAFAGATSEADAKTVRGLIAAHGDDWVRHFLDAKGVSHADAF